MSEDEAGNPTGSYFTVPVGTYCFEIEIGDYLFKEESEYVISVGNDHPTYGDGFQVDMNSVVVDGPSLPPLSDEWVFSHAIFEDRTSGALSDDQLPLEFPGIDSWSHQAIVSLSPGPINAITGVITDITVVPEPASLVMLLVGGLAVIRRR